MSAFTDEQVTQMKDILRQVLPDAIREERERRMLWTREHPQPDPEKERKVYLISLPYGQQVAVPSSEGSTIFHSALFVMVEQPKGKDPSFFGHMDCTIIANGDRTLLKTPLKASLPVHAAVEVTVEMMPALFS